MVVQRVFGLGRRALLVAALGVLLASCGYSGDGLRGNVRIDGSSTAYPIAEAVAEEFSKVERGVRVDVGFSGTGGGLEKFCRGEIHVANASRPITEREVQTCADKGITDILELQVAIDALTVVVHPSNDWAQCLTTRQVHDIFRHGGYTNWSQVDPSYPDRQITGYAPGTDSGTFDYFVEAMIKGVDETAFHRGDFTASEDDNILAQGVANDTNAIGYFGFAYFVEVGQDLNAVAIDDGHGCIAPSFEVARSGEYTPLSRPLLIYTRESLLAEDEAVRTLVQFYIESSDELVPEVGYVTMPEDVHQAQVAKIAPFLP
ncbi:MAG: PstS family phosphate ABC transporter substrate-binding protein [Dehalococcoidia bacterium]|nr:PstS family phosphate ABC transporter substrate-binding protein [Dehalococcoidia bacterium]